MPVSGSADTPAGDTGGDDAQEVLPVPAGPCLDARPEHRLALAFGVHMVRGALDEDAPACSRGRVKLVDLKGHLVLRARYPGAQVLIRGAVVRGAEHDASLVQLVVDGHYRQAEPAGVREPAKDPR